MPGWRLADCEHDTYVPAGQDCPCCLVTLLIVNHFDTLETRYV